MIILDVVYGRLILSPPLYTLIMIQTLNISFHKICNIKAYGSCNAKKKQHMQFQLYLMVCYSICYRAEWFVLNMLDKLEGGSRGIHMPGLCIS